MKSHRDIDPIEAKVPMLTDPQVVTVDAVEHSFELVSVGVNTSTRANLATAKNAGNPETIRVAHTTAKGRTRSLVSGTAAILVNGVQHKAVLNLTLDHPSPDVFSETQIRALVDQTVRFVILSEDGFSILFDQRI